MKSSHILILSAIVLLLLWWTYSYRQQLSKPIQLERLEMFGGIIDSVFVGNQLKYTKQEYYIVKNFSYSDGKRIDLRMDSMICAIKDPLYKEYKQYDIFLYKETRLTNRKKLLENDRIIDRHSQDNDRIYIYTWYSIGEPKDAFLRKKIRRGKIFNKHYFQCEE